MSWLSLQIWVELLMAAVIGGGVGWLLHKFYSRRTVVPAPANAPLITGPDGRARITELESKLAKAEAEADDLRRKSGIMPLGHRG